MAARTRIEHDVAAKIQEIRLPVDENGFVPALKEVTAALMPGVDHWVDTPFNCLITVY